MQRRICFTELEPEALEGHSQVFGPFALAYRIEDLRRIGALPVFYIPLESGGYLSRLPIEMLGGLIDAHRIAGTLLRVQTQLSQSPALGLKYREKEINFTPEQADVIRKFLNTLIDSAATNLDMTDARLRTMASCFYPTENPKYTDRLHYYRQREWRVVAGPFTYNGELCSRVATSQQAQMLLEIDRDFFSKRLSFFDAAAKLGEKVSDTIANRCHFLQRIGDLDVVALARCLVIPDDAAETSQLEQLYRERGVDVIRQSDVAKLALLPS